MEFRPNPRRPDRVAVIIEDSEGRDAKITLSDEAVVRLGLHRGDSINAATAERVQEAADEVRGFDLAMGALTRRSRSRRELSLYLARRGIPSLTNARVCGRLVEAGLVDDERFAREFVRSRVAGSGASVWLLRRDLGRKGVARETADEAIADVLGEEGVDETSVARTLADKQWRRLSGVARTDAATARRRLIAFLQRRGFGGDVVREVVHDLVGRGR